MNMNKMPIRITARVAIAVAVVVLLVHTTSDDFSQDDGEEKDDDARTPGLDVYLLTIFSMHDTYVWLDGSEDGDWTARPA